MEEKLKCKLCGKDCQHLGSHIWHAHKITARAYKAQFELPYKMPLISQSVWQKKHDKYMEREDEYKQNILKGGIKHQFKKGHSGHRRVSEHERKVIVARIKEVNKRKETPSLCLICKMQFNHIESHLYNAHGFIKVGITNNK